MSVSHYETAVALAHVEGQLFYAKKNTSYVKWDWSPGLQAKLTNVVI